MSLYIGNNSSGENILHITNTHQPESVLKDGTVPSTVFHSSLDYLIYEKFEFTKFADNVFKVGNDFIESWNNGMLNSYQYNGNTFYENVFPYIFVIDGIIVSMLYQLDDGRDYSGYTNGGNPAGVYSSQIIFYQKDLYRKYFQVGYISGYRTVFDFKPSPEYNNIWLYPNAYGSTPQEMYAIKINFNTLTKQILSKPGYNKGLPISINSHTISVNGVNLASLKYVSSGKINNIDTYAQDGLGNTLQFINSITSNSSASFNTLNGDIYIGGKKIFQGSVKNAFLYEGSYTWDNIQSSLYIYSNSPSYAEWNTGLYFPNSEFIVLCNMMGNPLSTNDILRFSYFLQKGGDEILVTGSKTIYNETKYQEGFILKNNGYLYYFKRSAGNGGYGNEVWASNYPSGGIICLSFK